MFRFRVNQETVLRITDELVRRLRCPDTFHYTKNFQVLCKEVQHANKMAFGQYKNKKSTRWWRNSIETLKANRIQILKDLSIALVTSSMSSGKYDTTRGYVLFKKRLNLIYRLILLLNLVYKRFHVADTNRFTGKFWMSFSHWNKLGMEKLKHRGPHQYYLTNMHKTEEFIFFVLYVYIRNFTYFFSHYMSFTHYKKAIDCI